MAHLRDSGLSADAAAGLVLARVKSCVSRRLPGAAEAFSAEEREQNRDGLGSETGDAVQQLALLFQAGIAVGFSLNFRVDLLDLPLKIRDMAFDALLDFSAGDMQPVHLLRPHALQRVAAGDKGAEFRQFRRGR
ncbi:hypothetical protein LDFHOB_09385 [Candidatus Electronema aureum]